MHPKTCFGVSAGNKVIIATCLLVVVDLLNKLMLWHELFLCSKLYGRTETMPVCVCVSLVFPLPAISQKLVKQ